MSEIEIEKLVKQRNTLLEQIASLKAEQKSLEDEREEILNKARDLENELNKIFDFIAEVKCKITAYAAEYKNKGNAILVLSHSIYNKRIEVRKLNNRIYQATGKAK